MEKIMLVMNAQKINVQAIDFGCYLSRLTNARLIGVFLEDVQSDIQPSFDEFRIAAEKQQSRLIHETAADTRTFVTEENIRQFRASCESQGIHANIHRDRGIPIEEVVRESRFADLLIVDPEVSFSHRRGQVPDRFVKHVLHEAECPVIIAPYSFQGIEEIYFAYNGSPSSVFSIKQFTYLFPTWKARKVTVIDVQEKNKGCIEDQYKMKEWLGLHYDNVELKILEGDSSDELFGYLLDKKNAMVVIGAYGRSMLSRLFKPSHAKLIVKTVNLPIFITHQ